MNISETALEGVYIVDPQVFEDDRGWFMESYSSRTLTALGIDAAFVQDNHSMSKRKGTLRGLHFQKAPHTQSKLVRCTKGSILDAAADIRKGSPNYCRWITVELSEKNKRQLFIPCGFAHGFLTLMDDTEVQYKTDDYYTPLCDRSIRFDDPQIGIIWGVENIILSEKDKNAPYLIDCDADFTYTYNGGKFS